MHLPGAQAWLLLESGTGSGSLTHSLARAIAPTGHVHTFEFHQPRAEAADKEFKEHGMGDIITVQQRNIEELGFPEELHNKADGLFLDLPGPWHAVESAAKCLRPNAVFCSFSPCIEQVQRTCAALEDNGFFAVRTMECLLRRYEVKQEKMTVVDDTFSAQQQTGNAKRKRQEDFQSRKRQALDQVANAVPSAETVTALENGPPAVNAVINTASTAAFESDSSNPAGTKAAPVPALVVGSPNLASTTTQPSPVTKGNNALAMDAVTKAAPAPAFEIASLSPAVTSTQSELITKGNNAASVDAVTQAATQPAVDGNGSISLASTDVQPDPKHIRFAQMLLAAVHQSSPGVIPSQLQQPSAESSHVVKLAGSISQLLENGIPSTIIEAANAAKEYVLGSSQSTLPENPANRELKQKPALPQVQKCVVAKPVNDARGHTGYLTFARRSVDD